jgi:hypothetical protein
MTQLCGRECALHWLIDFNAHVGNFSESYIVCVKTRFGRGQRLKPHLFYLCYGTAEAVPHKDLTLLIQI